MKTKFYRCKTCGNIIVKVIDGGPVPKCCGEEMEELKPNTSDGKNEYHLPVIEQCGDHKLKVKMGKEPHPMTSSHYIQFVYIETECGGRLVCLKPEHPAEVVLSLCEKPVAVYAYCNQHGLWKTICTACEQTSCCK